MVTKAEFRAAFTESLTTHLVEVNKAEEKRQNKKEREDSLKSKELIESIKKNEEELRSLKNAVDENGKKVNDMRKRENQIKAKELENKIKDDQESKAALAQTQITVSEQKALLDRQNEATQKMKEEIEGQGYVAEDTLAFQKQVARNTLDSIELQLKNPDLSPAKRKELKKEKVAQEAILLNSFQGIAKRIGDGFQKIGDLKVPGLGISLGALAKLALIPLFIKFLDSPVWQKIKEFVNKPTLKNFGEIFGEIDGFMLSFITILGALGIAKMVTTVSSVAALFTTIGGWFAGMSAAIGSAAAGTGLLGSLATIGGILGFTGAGAVVVGGGVILAAVAAVALFFKGMYDAFLTFKESLAEGDGFLTALGKSIKEFYTTLIDVPGNFIKNLIADILAFFGFYDTATAFKDFDLTTFISETIQKAYDYVVGLFSFGIELAKTKLKQLLGFAFGEGGLMDIVLAPVSKAINYVRGLFGFTDPEGEEFDLSASIRESFSKIFDYFGKILDIDVAKIVDAIPGATRILKAIGVIDKSDEEKIEELEYETKYLRAGIEAGDYDGIFRDSEDEKKELARMEAELQRLKAKVGGAGDDPVEERYMGGALGAGKLALVGEQGPELIMSRSPTQVFSEQRTDQIGMAAINRLMGGGGGGSGTTVIQQVSNNVNNTNRTSVIRPLSDQDPVLQRLSSSLAF